MNWRKVKQQHKQSSKKVPAQPTVHYAGFWSRVLAMVVDIFMIGIPIAIITGAIFGFDEMRSVSALDVLDGVQPAEKPDPMMAIVNLLLFAVAFIVLWSKDKGRTPGKRLAHIRIVDKKSLGAPAIWQFVVRYFAYLLSFISLIGFFLPLIMPRKEALHDLLSGTVVIYEK